MVSEPIRPGVVQLSTGAWYDPAESGSLCRHGNPNVLTRDVDTWRLGQGPSAQTVLVEVERFEGAPDLSPGTAIIVAWGAEAR